MGSTISKPVSPFDNILFLHKAMGNRAVQRLMESGVVQTKLTVGKPNDIYEQEADRVAEQVMRMPDLSKAQRKGVSECNKVPSIQRMCAGCEEELHRQPIKEEKEETLQTKEIPGRTSKSPLNKEAQINSARSGGRPLSEPVRAFFEPRFGQDLSQVRIHTDSNAEQSAKAVNAQAYTVGQDIVFGAGTCAPDTQAGRQLLAHELTHVVQQSKGVIAPMIQRRLLVTGDKKDLKAMLGLLEPASDFTLKHDPKTKEVSVARSGNKPQSPELANRLRSIIDDLKQDAEIHLGRKQKGVDVGAFPSDPEKAVQEIRIDHILALEKGAPGSGVAKLAHEMVENYEAHALKDYNWSVAFSASHEKALGTENLIEAELGHPGSRRNTFSVVIDPGKGKPRFLRGIEDREKYFLVWDQSFDVKGTVSNARRVQRVKVSTYKIDGFTAGSDSLPKAGEATITALAADLKGNPTASALVEGFAAAGGTPTKNVKLATEWTEMVRDKVIAKVADELNTHWRRFHVVGNAARAGNSVVITVERPDL